MRERPLRGEALTAPLTPSRAGLLVAIAALALALGCQPAQSQAAAEREGERRQKDSVGDLNADPGNPAGGGAVDDSAEAAAVGAPAGASIRSGPLAKVESALYPWMEGAEGAELTTLEASFAPPKGFSRISAAEGGFGRWLRGLPVRTDRHNVLAWDGSPLSSPSAAVIFLDVGQRDLQQCADTAIRLRAEFLWASGRAEEVAFHFTSGDRSAWRAWQRGERFKIAGNKVARAQGAARKNDHAELRRYLDNVFRYAGTQSLWRDSDPVPVGADILPGDFFVQPGGPGHAVVVLDVAAHPDGRRAALIGQGFMPAQELHVVRSDGPEAIDGVWFILPVAAADTLDTPSWRPFARTEVRRFK